jgi:hypothetical protein
MWERTCERHPPLKSKVAMQSEVLVTHELKVGNAGNSRKLTHAPSKLMKQPQGRLPKRSIL